MSRTLNVLINDVKVGGLVDNVGIWSFVYDGAWVKSDKAFPLCPLIPLSGEPQIDSSTYRPIQHFFDNLLPEEGARKLLAKDLKVRDESDTFLLLAKSGKESAGALTLIEDGAVIPERTVDELAKDGLSERIKNLPTVPLNNKKSKRMSLAGAQHKMLVVYQDGKFFEPNLSMPSTHILKPDHSEPKDFWHTTMNEWFVMKLARRMGLDVPEVYIGYVPEPVYVIERFDRQGKYPDHERLHIIDACQLKGLPRTSKYTSSQSHVYRDLIVAVRRKAETITKLFNWVVFNLLIGNGDAHLKNISFFQDIDGVRLSPFYDLLSTVIYEDAQGDVLGSELSIPIGGKEVFADVRYDDLMQFAKSIGMPPKPASKAIIKMCSKIEGEFEAVKAEALAIDESTSKPGEARMILEIEHKVLKPMLKNLSVK